MLDLDQAIRERHSTRMFLSRPVPRSHGEKSNDRTSSGVEGDLTWHTSMTTFLPPRAPQPRGAFLRPSVCSGPAFAAGPPLRKIPQLPQRPDWLAREVTVRTLDDAADFARTYVGPRLPHRRDRLVRRLQEISDDASARIAARAFRTWAIDEGLLAEET
jgi:hypothetical protein